MVFEGLEDERIQQIDTEIRNANDAENWGTVDFLFPGNQNDGLLQVQNDIKEKDVSAVYYFETNVSADVIKDLHAKRPTDKMISAGFNEEARGDIMYVGSTRDASGFLDRIKNHLGVASGQNALHLADWFDGNITLHYYLSKIHSVARLVETELYELYEPLLGQNR
jgi:hypothetical protein